MSRSGGSRFTPKHLYPKSVIFSVFSSEEIKKLSVVKIVTPLSFNTLGHPLKDGLYDPALGPLRENSDPCGTCGENVNKCPGHFGHIELPVLVVNPLFHKTLFAILKISCLKCFTVQIPRHVRTVLAAKAKLLDAGFYLELDDLDREVAAITSNCTEITEGEEEIIRETVENFVKAIFKKKSTKFTGIEVNIVTRNATMERQIHIDDVIKSYKSPGRICTNCQLPIPKLSALKNQIMIAQAVVATDERSGVAHKTENVPLMADQSRKYVRRIWENDPEIFKVLVPCLGDLNIEYPPDVFYFDTIPVLPPIVRPVNYLNGELLEHPQSQVYKGIIEDCLVLRHIIKTIQDGDTNQLSEEAKMVFNTIRGNSPFEKLHNAWSALQASVDHLMDREMSKTADSMKCLGIKQIIEKKEGVIRMHMMGKRVNFAARSVINPDPNLNIDEIGVPEAFAKKLTYPVPVTPWNVAEMRQLVINGPNQHPGAVFIENEDGFVKKIDPNNQVNREAIAKRLLNTSAKIFNGPQIVHRHLQNGDVMLLNRQPTLHKPSIMAHKARVLKGEKTLRLHYSNCKAYNADFDGDEMNAHFPQNEVARSEGYNIANVSNQYLVPKDGTPLGGLIQDHVISGVRLTLRGNFFKKQDYWQLVYSALYDQKGNIQTLPPAIIKPVQLWSGKQIISTIIINMIPKGKAKINMTAGTKITPKAWEVNEPRAWKCGVEFTDPKTMSEAEVIIRGGELLSGVLDKTHYGATPYGLIHCMYELYGGDCSTRLLSAFGKIFQYHLQKCGFTLGVEDILVAAKNDKKRREIIERCRLVGDSAQKAALGLPEDTPREVVKRKMEENYFKNKKFRDLVDRQYKLALDPLINEINKTCLPGGLLKKFPHNNLQLMVQSGAKGSTVNTMQISCLLGQIELEGKRPPLMISGKSLPCYPPFDPSPRAGGFIESRFMTGLKPDEFFFHCMAGREGLIDTAVKTSRSGYLQRCLIKHLEGLSVNYDSTVRDSDGSLIQTAYGEDGLDILKSRYLRKEQIDFLVQNKDVILDKEIIESLKDPEDLKNILKTTKKIKKWKSKNGDPFTKNRKSAFTMFSEENKVDTDKGKIINPNVGRSKSTLSVLKKWVTADEEIINSYKSKIKKCPEPLTSKYRSDLNFGLLSETIEDIMDDYLKNQNTSLTTPIDRDELRDLLCYKSMKSLCPPGEPVGLLAAQSIGEPSTQMTLNTFHFAGRGEMNMTLGIPRLNEILRTASKQIKTPSMEIPLKKDLPNVERQSKKVRLKLTKCRMSDVLRNIDISRKLVTSPNRQLEYQLVFFFLPHKNYKNEFNVTSKEVVEKTELLFLKHMFMEIKKVAKISGEVLHFQEEKRQRKNVDDSLLDEADMEHECKPDLGEAHESSDEEDAAEDADATAAKSRAKHQEIQEYDDPDEDEEMPAEDDVEDKEDSVKMELEENDLFDDDMELSHAEQLTVEQKKRDVVGMYPYGMEYDFDEKKYHWCRYKFWLPLKMLKIDLPTVLRSVAKKVVLWETPKINRAFTFQNTKGDTVLKTDGINIKEMFKYDKILDLNRLYSNDIYAISQTYGIEAANRVIVQEVTDVFKMYGITVDRRHLSLIADYMTFDGTFRPMNRTGMENCASPLLQMSFESSLNFLKNAVLKGKSDDLTTPSSRLMLGQPCKIGTGAFDCFVKLQMPSTSKNTKIKF